MSYTDKLIEHINTSSVDMLEKSESSPIVSLNSLKGGRITIPMSQSRIIQKSLATANFTPSSTYDNMLSSASHVQFNIDLGSILSSSYDLSLHLTVQNATGNPVELFPIMNWFNRIEIRFGSDIIQQFYSSDLYFYLWIWIDTEWRRVSDLMNLNDRFLPNGDLIPDGTTQEFILLIPHTVFRQTNLFCKAVSEKFILTLYMNQSTQIVRTGTAPTVSNLYLEFITSHISIEDTSRMFNAYRSGIHKLRYYWLVNQQIARNSVQANTTLDLELTSFTGLFNFIQLVVQPVSAVGLALNQTKRIKEFDLLDEAGKSYYENNALQSHNESLIWDAEIISPFSRFDEIRNVYKHTFSLSPREDLMGGKLTGYMPLKGKSRFRVNTGPAAVAKVITLTLSAAAASGNFRLAYTYHGETFYTAWMAFNAAVGTIETAIEGLQPFRQYGQQVTVSATMAAGVSVTITYSTSQELAADEYDKHALIIVDSQLLDVAPADVFVNSAISTHPIDGWVNGDYNFIIMGTQAKYLCITPEGKVRVSES
jgi:hypothetical protein